MINAYYDVKIKHHRLNKLKVYQHFKFYNKISAVINLVARAGVRYSMENPFVYVLTNTMGTLNLLDLCKEYKIKKFVLASTSSLYAGQKMPFSENFAVNTPISPYATSKS